jgi:3-deoxy-manno-octulosonate cytidylyltransferase (CMP-KDO synthetase)
MGTNSNFIVVIPARFGSKRLPGKPLKKILGIPMIIRTSMQCLKVVKRSQLIVATDDKRIQKCCKKYSINSILTSKNCKTGTDRVAEVAKKIKARNYINVQGDEPIFNPDDLSKMLKESKQNKDKILLGYTKIKNRINCNNKNIPKVVFDKNENLLYASRSTIPSSKKNKKFPCWRQVLVYSFPRSKILKFYKIKKKTTLEKIEDIEILRFLEIGFDVKLVKMSNKSYPVDTRKDLYQVEKFLSKKKIDFTL